MGDMPNILQIENLLDLVEYELKDSSEKEFLAMKPAYMTTNAYVFKKDKKYVWTFASYDEETFSDRNLIPKGLILSMKKVEI